MRSDVQELFKDKKMHFIFEMENSLQLVKNWKITKVDAKFLNKLGLKRLKN